MITSANIRVLFYPKSYFGEKLNNAPSNRFLFSLVFIENHTIKYDVEKYSKNAFGWQMS